ncbi:MAG: hypothetical protein HC850_03225 [Rhodomicrobium sp.]|nr:hypothetical protein [Rhodomicrobium sp.]
MAPVPASKFIPELGFDSLPQSARQERDGEPSAPRFASIAAKAASRIEEAYRSGFAAGRAEAEAEFAQTLEEHDDRHAQQIALERYAWANREADKLAVKIEAGLKEIEGRLGEIVARVLRPFLVEAIHRQAVAELGEALDALIGANEGVSLEIFGPEDLLQLLRDKLGSMNVAAIFTPSESVDVRVVAGQTVLETCLGTWMKKIEECVS